MPQVTTPRRSMRRSLLHVASAALCVGCIGPFSEMIEHEYASTKAARAAGALDDGAWIPEIVPDDAVVIHEVHDIDTNATWGCFTTQNLGAVRGRLSVLNAAVTRGPIDQGPNEILRDFSRWPDAMRSSTIEALEFHESPAAPALPRFVVRVGIDGTTGTVCFHRTL
jgi:hypothetical protein